MNFYEKNFSIYLFYALRSNFQDFGWDHNVQDTALHILNIFSGEVLITFSKIIQKKTKKVTYF